MSALSNCVERWCALEETAVRPPPPAPPPAAAAPGGAARRGGRAGGAAVGDERDGTVEWTTRRVVRQVGVAVGGCARRSASLARPRDHGARLARVRPAARAAVEGEGVQGEGRRSLQADGGRRRDAHPVLDHHGGAAHAAGPRVRLSPSSAASPPPSPRLHRGARTSTTSTRGAPPPGVGAADDGARRVGGCARAHRQAHHLALEQGEVAAA